MKGISFMKCKKFVNMRKIFSTDKNDKNLFKLYHKVRDHCHSLEKQEELLIVFEI